MKMLTDNVLLLMDKAKNETENGLTISVTEPPQAMTGTVIAVGPGEIIDESVCWDEENGDWTAERKKPEFSARDRVCLSRYHDSYEVMFNGVKHSLVSIYDVVAIVDSNDEVISTKK